MVYALGILELAGLNIILALSVYATLMVGQFSLAQVGFWSIGAYSVGMLTTLFGVPLALALVMAGLLCGVIGISMGTVNPFMGSSLLLTGFVIIVLAGLGSVVGAMVCGLLVGVIEMTIVGMVSASMKEAVLFVILFTALVFRPQGLFAGPDAKRD